MRPKSWSAAFLDKNLAVKKPSKFHKPFGLEMGKWTKDEDEDPDGEGGSLDGDNN
jgi:hypothetical protein